MDPFTFEIDGAVTGDWAVYRRFVEMWRIRLAHSHSHNRPVLRPELKVPVDWLQVVLKVRSLSTEIAPQITLRIRQDNLYLDGYRARDSDPWLVFGTGKEPNFLGFGGSYTELSGAANQKIEETNLGPQELRAAVTELATTTINQKRARCLLVVILMICEGIRFIRISDHLADPHNRGAKAPLWMKALVHGWGNLSDALLRADADPNRFFRLTKFNDMEIKTAEEAAAVLGILKLKREKTRILDNNLLSLQQGRPMVEVFWVRIDNVGGGRDPGQLHGTIAVVDGLSSQKMYDRQRSSPETISPGGNILLIGPDRAITAFDSFTVDLSLQNKAAPSRDDEVSNGSIIWNVFDTAKNVFDRVLYADVKGAHGSATACYTVLSDAVEATISVELVNAGGKDPAQVYGEIAASYSNYPSGQQTLLFRKKREEHISVRPGQPIELTKKTVAVPTSHSLSVRAELYDSRTTPPGGEIVNGVAVLPRLFDGASQMNITGRFGNVLVKVAWNPSWRAAK